MRNRLRAVALLLPVLAITACGGGGGGDDGSASPTGNAAPTANFAFSCADLTCAFTSTSTDQDVGDSIAAYSWAFGDGSNVPVTSANTSHAFAAAGSYDVTLMVGDRSGAISNVVKRVTVTVPPQPAAPHANFTSSCSSLDCTFTDTSTFDAGSAGSPASVFQSRSWDFGDGTALAATNPATHRYAATTLTTFTVKLTVTDTAGKTSTNVQSIVAAPPATTLNCTGGNCTLALTTASRVTATLVSHSCDARNNRVQITAPAAAAQTIFADGCFDPVGTSVSLNGGNAFAANTQLELAVYSGIFPAAILVFQPTIRVTGDFTNGWTVTFDDGFGGPGEPDFNDLVILIKATP